MVQVPGANQRSAGLGRGGFHGPSPVHGMGLPDLTSPPHDTRQNHTLGNDSQKRQQLLPGTDLFWHDFMIEGSTASA